MMDHIDAEADPVKRAEKRIQQILLDLEYETDDVIESVEVDTRLYASLRTHIIMSGSVKDAGRPSTVRTGAGTRYLDAGVTPGPLAHSL